MNIATKIIILALMGLAPLCRADSSTTITEVEPKQLLEQLCRLDPNAVQLKRISEVKSIAALLVENNGSGCDMKVVDAIKKLALVVEPADRNVCLPESINAIVNFHSEFIRRKSKSEEKHLPKSLKRFFLAYSLQASNRCRGLMMDELTGASTRANIGSGEEYGFVTATMDRVQELFDYETPVENLLGVVLGDKLDKLVGLMYRTIRLPDKMTIDQVHGECRRKYMPVYNVLIMPILRLAAIGYNFRDAWNAVRMENQQKKVSYMRWFAAVLICESTRQRVKKSIKEMVDETTETNMDGLKEVFGLNELNGDNNSVEIQHRPAYPYEIPAKLDDLILDKKDTRLRRALAGLKYKLGEMTKYRIRMAARVELLVKRKLGFVTEIGEY